MSDDDYFEFCQARRALRIERTAKGEIVVRPASGVENSYRRSDIAARLGNWANEDGKAFLNAGLTLPDRAVFGADVSWVENSRLASFTKEQKRKFMPLCPDFVVELTSPSDRLSQLQKKMRQWLKNGAKLGWLLDADRRTAYISRPGQNPEQRAGPDRLEGEGPVSGFVLELANIWTGL